MAVSDEGAVGRPALERPLGEVRLELARDAVVWLARQMCYWHGRRIPVGGGVAKWWRSLRSVCAGAVDGNLVIVESAARELPGVALDEAFAILALLAAGSSPV